MKIPTADVEQMEIHYFIYVVTASSNAVIKSKRFERVLARFLAVYKFLNAGTKVMKSTLRNQVSNCCNL